MNFEQILLQAKEADEPSVMALIETYKPLLVRQSTFIGKFDEDLYQNMLITLLQCIHAFHLDYTETKLDY